MKKFVAAAAFALASAAPMAATTTVGTILFGTGVTDGNFTVSDESTYNYLEMGLRARTRFPSPSNDFSPLTGNTYTQIAGGYTDAGAAGGPLASWNFDWSIHTPGNIYLESFTYRLTIDYDPGAGTGNNQSFDLIWDYATWGKPGGYFDHSFGDGGSPTGSGTEATNNAGYLFLLDEWNNTTVQNSWNMGWFTDATHVFDPNAIGLYTITLDAFLNSTKVVTTSINVNVVAADVNNVPEPGTLALLGLGLAGLAIRRRRS